MTTLFACLQKGATKEGRCGRGRGVSLASSFFAKSSDDDAHGILLCAVCARIITSSPREERRAKLSHMSVRRRTVRQKTSPPTFLSRPRAPLTESRQMIGSRGAGSQQTGPIKKWKRRETPAGVKRVSFFFERPANPNIAAQCSRTPRAQACASRPLPPSPPTSSKRSQNTPPATSRQDAASWIPRGYGGRGSDRGGGTGGGERGGLQKQARPEETKEDAFLQNPLVLAATRLKKNKSPKTKRNLFFTHTNTPMHERHWRGLKATGQPTAPIAPTRQALKPTPASPKQTARLGPPLVHKTRPARSASLEKSDGLSRALSSSQVPCASSSPCDALLPVSRSHQNPKPNPTVFRAGREGGGEGGRAGPRQDTKEERSGETSRDGQFSACSLT